MSMYILAGGLMRGVQGLCWCAPTLLVGLLIAGLLRFYVGRAGTKRLFGGDTLWSLPQSWLWGMLLPVCSIGVIPILYELRRAGMRAGAISAFALAAPLFNPLSLLYGLTLSRPFVILTFAGISLLLVTALGLLWDYLSKPVSATANDEPNKSEVIGFRRLIAMADYMMRELTGTTGALLLVALSGLVILGCLFPHGHLQTSAEQTDFWAPLRMTLVAVPIYATPMLTMSQMGMMFQHGNSPGAALALLLLGTGVNLGTLVWMARHFRWKATATWFIALVSLVILVAYTVEKPLIPPGVEPAGHTHAFDIYTNPFHSSSHLGLPLFKETLSRQSGLGEFAALAVVALMFVGGLLLRVFDRGGLAAWLQRQPPRSAPRGWDIIVPPAVLGVVAIIGLIAMSVVGCFAYYPDPSEAMEELRVARVETLSGATSGNYEHAAVFLEQWDDWSRKLEVGAFLRNGEVRPYQRMLGYLLRKKLELLEHEMEESPPDKPAIQKLVTELMFNNQRLQRAYQRNLK